jgi:hypothetical protein
MTDFERWLHTQHKTGGNFAVLYQEAAKLNGKRPANIRADYAFVKWLDEYLADEHRALLKGAFKIFTEEHAVGPATEAANPDTWLELFHTRAECEAAPPLTFAIEGFLQADAITGIAGLSGHSKTLTALSVVRALLAGPNELVPQERKLWDYFPIMERAKRVLYLIPESSLGPFVHRLKLFGIYEEVEKRLFVRTLTKGPTVPLADARILRAAKGAHIITDTAIRFMGTTDESSASEVAAALSTDLLNLLAAEARAVMPLFHSPKSFGKESEMTLENMVRGSSELGAVLATCWGLKRLDEKTNLVHVQNLKPRDFEPCGPFQLLGRPCIDRDGDFRLHQRPGDCGTLVEEQPSPSNEANEEKKKLRTARLKILSEWDPKLTSKDVVAKFAAIGHDVSESTVRKYRMDLANKSEMA